MIATIREKLEQVPFEPFDVRTSAGKVYRVSNPGLVVLMKSKMFVAERNSDRAATLSYLHITAIEDAANGHSVKRTPRRRR